MKAKKALKKLSHVEALLSNVMDQFSGSKDGLASLLDSAKLSISKAIESVSSSKAAPKAKTTARGSKTARNGRLSEEGRKRISLAAKKRWASARRKGVNAVTGRRLTKTG